MNTSYPKRPPFFALKFARVMVKTCVANELGQDVFTLLAVIAFTEDAACYRRPVNYHNSQLMSVCGFQTEDKLARVRHKAVEAGWLHYVGGSRRHPPLYWVAIPHHARGLDDGPTDEQPGEFDVEQSLPTDADRPSPAKAKVRSKRGRSASDLRSECVASLPIPNPYPSPVVCATAEPAAPKPPRPRDELFDAVTEVTGMDPAVNGPLIGKLKSKLAKADPPYTPDEVREFGRRFWQICTWASQDNRTRPTPGEVEKYIGQIRAKPARPATNAPRGDFQTEYAKQSLRGILFTNDSQPEN